MTAACNGGIPNLIGRAPLFSAALEAIRRMAGFDAPALLQGETGTGKELAANYIHNNSARRNQAFMTVDCTVLTEPLFEAEVFGHARGAFTGSDGERIGMIRAAV